MSDETLSSDEIRRMAGAIGLDRLTEEHMQQLTRAANVAHARRRALLSATLTPADEPGHVFRLVEGDMP